MPQPSSTYNIQPRVCIDLLPDGSLRLDYSIGPYRHQEILNKGWEMSTIMEALQAQASANAKQREDAANHEKQLEAERRRRNWRNTAINHGIEFANKTINGVNSSKQHARVDEKTKSQVKAEKEQFLSLL